MFETAVIVELVDSEDELNIEPKVFSKAKAVFSVKVGVFAISKPSGNSEAEKYCFIETNDEMIEDETVDCAEPMMNGSCGAEMGGADFTGALNRV